MELKLGDVQTTALIPLAVKANETLRKNARIKDTKAVEIIRTLKTDTKPYDKFMSHEGVVARTIMLDRQLKGIIKKAPDTTVKNTNAHFASGTDSGQEIADLTDGIKFIEEHSFNEEMKKYSIRGKLLALLLPKVNDRWATFRW